MIDYLLFNSCMSKICINTPTVFFNVIIYIINFIVPDWTLVSRSKPKYSSVCSPLLAYLALISASVTRISPDLSSIKRN